MTDSTQYGLMVYNANRDYNVGDYIQSLAAKQYLPKVDRYLCREHLTDPLNQRTKLILNGWFMDQPNWPPDRMVDPLFVSFHLNSHIANELLSPQGLEFFKQNAPIGCRDPQTQAYLQDKGVDAYWSSCLTTTLDLDYARDPNPQGIVFCDVLFSQPDYGEMLQKPRAAYRALRRRQVFQGFARRNLLNSLFTKRILGEATYVTHKFSRHEPHERRFSRADELLRLYAKARFVVTSRIHCALPCLAIGTPVLFIDSGFEDPTETCRLKGIIDMMNVISIATDGRRHEACNFEVPEKIDIDLQFQNPTTHYVHATRLKERCREFVNNAL